MILYKNAKCTIPALCPLCFSQPADSGADYYCTSECAWCSHYEYNCRYFSRDEYKCNAVPNTFLYGREESNE